MHKAEYRILLPWFVLLAIGVQYTTTEESYYSSVDSLRKLIELEFKLVDHLRHYVEMRENQLANYRKFLQSTKDEHALVSEDIENYLGNPVKAFMLIKRMFDDWSYLRSTSNHIKAHEEFIIAFNNSIRDVPLLDQDDLLGAYKGLERLENIYDLSEHPLVNEISWRECFEIAHTLYSVFKALVAIKWFKVTVTKLNADFPDRSSGDYKNLFILSQYYMAQGHFWIGDVESAVEHFKEIVNISPTHRAANILHNMSTKELQWIDNYKRLCRGEQDPDPRLHKLKCKLETKGRPYFTLAPLKTEELSLDPEINLYHGLLQDSQIEKILTEAGKAESIRSQVIDLSVTDKIRVSQGRQLHVNSTIGKTVKHLLEEITGLDSSNSKILQVITYGVGGMYKPHYDFYFESDDLWPQDWHGNRMASQVFYLSDVVLGGYTAFPFLNVYVRPEKGAMLMFYNLHRTLAPDFRLYHGACPVLKGFKRIGVGWIHAHYQEFRYPCDLHIDDYKSEDYKFLLAYTK